MPFSSEAVPGGGGHVFDTLAIEIEQLLSKVYTTGIYMPHIHEMFCVLFLQLRQVNSSMNEYVSSLNPSTRSTTLYHTLQRHNEILQDYSQEFKRIKVQ